MTGDSSPPSDNVTLSYDPEAVQQAEALIEGGDYETGIARLQKIARASGDEALMQRLIELRAEGFEKIAERIVPEPMFEANQLLDNVAALRERLATDGYLFFRSVVPVERLTELRDQITRILADQGWIADGEERMKAIARGRPRREGQPRFFRAHDKIVKLEALHSLAHEPHVMEVMRKALGDSAFPHPLSIVRLVFPDSPELSTPPHQDYPNNQGTPNLTAAWMPLADCSVKDGSLAVLEGSHQYGVLPLRFHLGAGNRRAVLPEEFSNLRWVGADFRLGDLVLFPALTVHKAMENHNPERMRLSVDFRYQLEGEALTEGCLKPHFERVSWEEIYADWQSDELKYYWRDKNYVEVPWNPALHELPPDHVDEAYEQELAFSMVLARRKQEHSPA
ncbi:MAG: phytanoyl-CoA dioxygenase family protein [Halioglobus sp.]|nr:phytanoyl-CoA dioxygenase family protein [Halioglobus sp.]